MFQFSSRDLQRFSDEKLAEFSVTFEGKRLGHLWYLEHRINKTRQAIVERRQIRLAREIIVASSQSWKERIFFTLLLIYVANREVHEQRVEEQLIEQRLRLKQQYGAQRAEIAEQWTIRRNAGRMAPALA